MLKRLLPLSLCLQVSAGFAVGCNPASPTAMDGYTPFVLTNSSNVLTAPDLYVTVFGQNFEGEDVFVLFGATGVGVPATAGQYLPVQYSYPFDFFSTGATSPVLYIPNILPNASIYISVNYPLALVTTQGVGSWNINPPAENTSADANYYHLYDSIAVGLTGTLQLSGNYINSYGLPLSVRSTYNEGYVTYFLGLDPSVQRDDGTTASVMGLANYMTSQISNPSAAQAWVPLIETAQLAGNGGATAYLRMLSPTQQLGGLSGQFGQTYLFDTNYGADWFSEVFGTFYNGTNPLYLDVSSLAGAGADYTTYHQSNISGNTITFTPDGFGGVVTVSPTCSQAFFSNDNTAFNIGGAGAGPVNALICSYLSAGFVSGLFPTAFPQGTPMSYPLMQQIYLADPNGFWGSNAGAVSGGPWYNLYAAVIHELSPHVETNNFSNNDANNVDVDIGFFYTIPPQPMPTDPYVTITLGNMQDSVIPDFSDARPYNVTFAPGVGANYLYGATTILGGTTPVHVTGAAMPIDLIVGYSSGTYSGATYATQIYLCSPTEEQYTVTFPQLPAAIVPSFNASTQWWQIGAGVP